MTKDTTKAAAVHRGRPRPYPYAPGVHAAVRHGRRIAVSMRDGSRSLRQITGIAQHDAIYEFMRAHKEMRYLSRHITDEEIEALAQYYANMPHWGRG
jgi:hypothetical protein